MSTTPTKPDVLDADTHRQEGAHLFNHVWSLLEAEDRTTAQDDEMLHAAHASRWHWAQTGVPDINQRLAVGEWQCSRVYAVLGRGEPSLHHARRCVDLVEAGGMEDWVAASAYEAMAPRLTHCGRSPRLRGVAGKGTRRDGAHRRSRGPRGDRERPGHPGRLGILLQQGGDLAGVGGAVVGVAVVHQHVDVLGGAPPPPARAAPTRPAPCRRTGSGSARRPGCSCASHVSVRRPWKRTTASSGEVTAMIGGKAVLLCGSSTITNGICTSPGSAASGRRSSR